MFVDEDDNVCIFGKNKEGQLGQGHLQAIDYPVLLDFGLDKMRKRKKRIRRAKAKGHQNIVITEEGQGYYWPLQENEQLYPEPIRIPLPKMKILDAALGYNFVVLLTSSGLVYSFGSNNNNG